MRPDDGVLDALAVHVGLAQGEVEGQAQAVLAGLLGLTGPHGPDGHVGADLAVAGLDVAAAVAAHGPGGEVEAPVAAAGPAAQVAQEVGHGFLLLPAQELISGEKKQVLRVVSYGPNQSICI